MHDQHSNKTPNHEIPYSFHLVLLVGITSIAKAGLPEAFHLELKIIILAFEKQELKDSTYLGDKVLYVPVRFSL
ncbi:MAG: hypothetical protein ACI81P_003071 [Neolewinella sp.]